MDQLTICSNLISMCYNNSDATSMTEWLLEKHGSTLIK